ncbi:MAG: hypothetical protein GQ477_05635 [Nanohaloarchaea archaeon]|nr:hypothetical protein [Candidatus Nanohaloarchaea archaeon]
MVDVLRSKRKGFVYSLFSVLVIISIFGILSISSNSDMNKDLEINIDEKLRTDELFYFKEGAKQDFSRSAYISGKRAVIALVDDILRDGNYSTGYADDVIEALAETGIYGNVTPNIMENSTIVDWSDSISHLGQLHRISVSIDLIDTDIQSVDAFTLDLSNEVNVSVTGDIFGIQFTDSVSSENKIDIGAVEDPLISIESYGYLRQIINRCDTLLYPYHAQMVSDTGIFSYSSGDNWTSGRLSFDIDDSDPALKILVVSDIPDLPNNADDFLGVVSENVSDDATGISNYIFGATSVVSNLSGLLETPIIVMTDDAVWSSYIYDEVNESCYFIDSLGPSFLDRLEGNLETTSRYNLTNKTVGIASFITVTELPEELQNAYSSVDFKYFGEVSGKRIKGVTESEVGMDLVLGFLLDDGHISLWGLSGLDYV